MDVARQQAQQGPRQRAFAAARFPKHDQRLIMTQLKANPIHSSHHSFGGAKVKAEVLHAKQRAGAQPDPRFLQTLIRQNYFRFFRIEAHRVLSRGLKTRSRAKPTSAKPAPVSINRTEGASTQ